MAGSNKVLGHSKGGVVPISARLRLEAEQRINPLDGTAGLLLLGMPHPAAPHVACCPPPSCPAAQPPRCPVAPLPHCPAALLLTSIRHCRPTERAALMR